MKRLLAVSVLLFSIVGTLAPCVAAADSEALQRDSAAQTDDMAARVTRGAYLARIGSCATCHTTPGGARYAGGRGIPTPFGTVYAGNLTPDPTTGIGAWSADDFWHALHEGRTRDGRLLYPAFPYPSYTKVTREDADALYAYLRTIPPVRHANRPHALRFPYDTRLALYFRPGVYVPQPAQSDAWNRGAYLVTGLGHCGACHAGRDAFGAAGATLHGGLIPVQGWYAPSLHAPDEAGVTSDGTPHDAAHLTALLRDGVAPNASVAGPMAEVVYGSTQYLNAADLRAMATYLAALPSRNSSEAQRADGTRNTTRLDPVVRARGAALYDQHCADCHGKQGKGAAGKYPALAGNRAVTLTPAVNVIRVVLNGGFAPATAGNPHPYGMPPFAPFLDDRDAAAVISYIRNAWGNTASSVTSWEVERDGRGTAAR